MPNAAVLVAGGISTTIVANAEIYNPKKGTWNSTNRLTIPRLLHTATTLRNGKILIVTGDSTSGLAVASAELGVRVGQ